MNPILESVHGDPYNNWYYPWKVPEDVATHPLYLQAVEEGWSEWIQSPMDWTAVKEGYMFDLSRDHHGRPAYFIDGRWQLHDGTEVEPEDEAEHIAYCGKADAFLRFAEVFLKMTKEDLAGKPYRFIPWQRKFCAELFGWVRRPDEQVKSKLRRYQTAYVAIAKKNAKSALLSVISLYCLVGEGKPNNYVYSCACDRNQARIIYTESANMVKSSDALQPPMITVVDSRSRLVHEESGSYYQVLASDSGRNDGIDSACTLVDEIHRHKDRKLYSVMKRAGLARREPLNITITTYGPSTTDGSIWAEVHNASKAQMQGDRPDNWRHLVCIASAEPIPVVLTSDCEAGARRLPVYPLQQPVDETQVLEFDLSKVDDSEGDNKVLVQMVEPARRGQDYIVVKPIDKPMPRNSETQANLDWATDYAIKRANPSVGITFAIDVIRKEIRDARESPATEAEMKQLNLNIASGSGDKWISSAAWQSCGAMQVQPKKLLGRVAYGGFDISFGNDLTAFALAFPNWDVEAGGNFHDTEKPRVDLLVWAWLPTQEIMRREEVEEFPYRYYSKKSYFDNHGHIRFCEGKVIDYTQVSQEILHICSHFRVRCIAVDPNMASFVVPKIETEGGIMCVSHRQGAVSMAPPTKRFAEAVYGGWLAHGNNPILTRAVEGAILARPDTVGNTYPTKKLSYNRIDPLIAAIMATGFVIDPPEGYDGAYTGPGTGMWG